MTFTAPVLSSSTPTASKFSLFELGVRPMIEKIRFCHGLGEIHLYNSKQLVTPNQPIPNPSPTKINKTPGIEYNGPRATLERPLATMLRSQAGIFLILQS